MAVVVAVLLAGCAFFARFAPNTLVKTYNVVPENKKLTVDQYDVKFMIRAMEIGNLGGIDTFEFTIELKSADKITGNKDTARFGIPRLSAMTVYLPVSADSIVIEADRLDRRPLETPPVFFNQRIYEYFKIRDIVLPDANQKIEVAAEFQIHDRGTGSLVARHHLREEFVLVEELRWYEK
jgi:hypothetical protein